MGARDLAQRGARHAGLEEYGAPTARVTANDLASPGTVYQIGVAPIRIDILTTIDGVTFDEAWPNRVRSRATAINRST